MTTTGQTRNHQPMINTPGAVQTPTAKRGVSPNQRRAEIVIAILFLLTAAVSIVGGSLLDPKLESPDYIVSLPTAAPLARWVWPV